MLRRTRWIGGGAIALAVIGGGTGIAIATGADQDTPLVGSDLDQATAAALVATGGGSVVESEMGDDGAAYSVEIRLANGRVVEVSIDGDFNVTGNEADDDAAGDQSGPNDD